MYDADDDGHLHLVGVEEGQVVAGQAPDLIRIAGGVLAWRRREVTRKWVLARNRGERENERNKREMNEKAAGTMVGESERLE